jgi:hypothetical protein
VLVAVIGVPREYSFSACWRDSSVAGTGALGLSSVVDAFIGLGSVSGSGVAFGCAVGFAAGGGEACKIFGAVFAPGGSTAANLVT